MRFEDKDTLIYFSEKVYTQHATKQKQANHKYNRNNK